MSFSLDKKIEEIRKKPEHIRLRYVYGIVGVIMVFIIIIWAFSIKDSLKRNQQAENKDSFSSLREKFDNFNAENENPSLKDLLEETGSTEKKDINNTKEFLDNSNEEN